MSIKKQEFYEGAALHLLIRNGLVRNIRYNMPFFVINENLIVLLKYSTRVRSPWGFTFTADEQNNLQRRATESEVVIGLVCGADGVAALPFADFLKIAALRNSSIHIACYRNHWKQYDVRGPNGNLSWKVSPSNWQRILDTKGE